MPFQVVDEQLGEAQLARRKALLESLPVTIASSTWSEARQRYGILNMDVEGRKFWPHQLIAMQRLCMVDNTVEWEKKEISMVFSHDPGLGKTILTMAIMGGLWQFVPSTDMFKALCIVPTNVAEKWYTTITGTAKEAGWTTFSKEEVMYPLHESEITVSKLERAKVVILTPSIVMMAYKTYMWEDPDGLQWTSKQGKLLTRPKLVRGYDPSNAKKHDKYGGRLPPMHPLFAYNANHRKVWSMVAVDEAHEHTSLKKTHVHAASIRELTHNATYCFALTGTPVQHKVEEMPGMCRLLNVRQLWMHSKRYWSVKGGGAKTLRKSTSQTFFDGFVDRVAKEMVHGALVEAVTHRVEFDPWIGLLPNGSYEEDAIEVHNAFHARAETEHLANSAPNATNRRYDNMWQAWNHMSHFAFDVTLGFNTSGQFHRDKLLYEESLRKPSQYVELLHRIVRSRQEAGHPRIAIFSEAVVELNIALNYLERKRDCGRMVMFDGTIQQNKRQKVLQDFLSDEVTPKGVLAFSKAGSHAVDMCPGCEVMIVIGDYPWSPMLLEQAKARIRRVSIQTKPVEYIEMVPRRGIMAAKIATYKDKAARLVLGCRDANFSEYQPHAVNQVFLRGKLNIAMAPVDKRGNYEQTPEMTDERRNWEFRRDAAAGAGEEFDEPEPAICAMPEPKLARFVEIPNVAFPVEGYKEPEHDFGDDAINEGVRKSRALAKRVREDMRALEERQEQEAKRQRLLAIGMSMKMVESDEDHE
tara:strand:+ start:234 stop:2489 length:2256 start_codon:yes stop_codon:yes gene_type:complete